MFPANTLKQILIIDDDQDFSELFTILLELEGYHVINAPNAVDAVALLQCQIMDLIVTELKYSFLDGFQFLKWLREDVNISTPVLVLTATVEKGLKKRLLNSGASSVLFKPANDHVILNEIEKLI